MKRIFLILLFFSACGLYAQSSGWFWQNPLPQGNDLGNLQFVNSNTAFANSYNRVLRTSNGGTNWQLLETGQYQSIISIYFLDANTGYVLCDSGKVLKTTNSGSAFQTIADLQNRSTCFMYFADSQTGYVIARNSFGDYYGTKLFRTSNGGANWNLIIADTSIRVRYISFPNSITGYSGGSYGSSNYVKILKTTNSGLNWDSLPQNFRVDVMGITFTDALTGYLFGSGFGQKGVARTTDGGLNWSQQISGNFYVSNLQCIDANNVYAVGSEFAMLQTTNSGTNWLIAGYVNESGQGIKSMKFLNSLTGYFVGEAGRIMKSTNAGINWSYQSNGQHDNLGAIKFLNNNVAYACGNGIILKSTNAGTSWSELINDSAGDFSYNCLDFINETTGIVAGFDFPKRTTNGGTNWQTIYGVVQGIFTDVYFPSVNTGYLLNKGGGMFKTTNSGVNWNSIAHPFPNAGNIYFGSVFFLNDVTGFVAGGLSGFGAIAKTTDGGNTWDSTRIFNSAWLNDILFIDQNTGFVAGFNIYTNIGGGAILKSTDGGNTWNQKFITDNYYFNSICFADANTGYSVNSGGEIAKTTNGGENWVIRQTETNKQLYSVHFLNSQTGFAAGSGGTILKTTTGGEPIGLQPISTEVPYGFVLHQNYPNPFNPVTRIKISIPLSRGVPEGRGVLVQLKIYDITGREVAILINEQLTAGVYEVDWDASAFASGVYFYQLIVNTPRPDKSGHPSLEGNIVQTKKMVLLK